MRHNAGGEDGCRLADSADLRLSHAEKNAVLLLLAIDPRIGPQRGGGLPEELPASWLIAQPWAAA